MNYRNTLTNYLARAQTSGAASSSEAPGQRRDSGFSWTTALSAAATGALLLLNPAAAAGTQAALRGPRRALTQCGLTPETRSYGFTAFSTEAPSSVLSILGNTTWGTQGFCGRLETAPSFIFTCDETFTTGLTDAVANQAALSSADSLAVEVALGQLTLGNVNASFTGSGEPSSPNLMFQSATSTSSVVWYADGPGTTNGIQSHITYIGSQFETNPAYLRQPIGLALGLELSTTPGSNGRALATEGPFSADRLSTTMTQTANACYRPTAWGALDLEALGLSLGTTQWSNIEVTLSPPWAGDYSVTPYVGGMYVPGQNNALTINGSDFEQIFVSLDNSGTTVSKIDNNIYLLSPSSNITSLRFTNIGSTGATIVGMPWGETLEATPNNDVIDGDGGNDIITTGAGNDVVIVGPWNGIPLITDFDVNEDQLAALFPVSSVADLDLSTFSSNGYTGLQIGFPNGKQVQLANVPINAPIASFLATNVGYLYPASCYAGQAQTNGMVARGGTMPVQPRTGAQPSPPTPSPTVVPPSPQTPGTTTTSHGSSSIGVVAGAIGGVAAAIVAAVGYCCWRKRRRDAATLPTGPANNALASFGAPSFGPSASAAATAAQSVPRPAVVEMQANSSQPPRLEAVQENAAAPSAPAFPQDASYFAGSSDEEDGAFSDTQSVAAWIPRQFTPARRQGGLAAQLHGLNRQES